MPTSKRNEPGKSAQAEYLKRVKKREEKVQAQHPKIGKFLLKVISEADTTKAWKKGADGEEYIGKILEDYCTKNSFVVLHDLAVPKSKSNIDHILITSFGVFVLDAKNYQGLIEIRDRSGFFEDSKPELYIGGRKQQVLIEKIKKQIELVKDALPSFVPVHGIIAFYEGQFPLFFKPKEIDGVLINSKGINHILENFPKTKKIDVDITVKKLDKTFKSYGN
jgi:hypothetical protein